jgi:hypothetical protein
VPDIPKVNDHDFSVSLSRTIEQLQRDATNASVTLPPNYSFSFEAQKARINFAPNSLDRLAIQLGEVKTICGLLFQAKINSLDNFRRERVSSDDAIGPQTDYLTEKSVTNELAVLTPYEITFRCFSSELAAVLEAIGGSPYGIVAKTINVEVAPAPPPPDISVASLTPQVQYQPQYTTPQPSAAVDDAMQRANAAAAFARRYGLGGAAQNLGGIALREGPAPAPVYSTPVLQPTAPAQAKGGLPTVLDEKQLKITLSLVVIKLLPSK